MRRTAEFGAALLLDLIGAAGALLIATRTWQVVRVRQPRPLPDEVLHVTGRTVDAAVSALAVVALAGVVALLATRGLARRIVGVVLAAVGAAMIWQAVLSAAAVSAVRARELIHAHHPGVTLGGGAPQITTTATWPALTVVCGVLVMVAGAWAAARGHRWSSLSARYENRAGAAPDPGAADARAAASMWNALDRGDDPTSRAEGDSAGPEPRR